MKKVSEAALDQAVTSVTALIDKLGGTKQAAWKLGLSESRVSQMRHHDHLSPSLQAKAILLASKAGFQIGESLLDDTGIEIQRVILSTETMEKIG
jgi:hypothetical protein